MQIKNDFTNPIENTAENLGFTDGFTKPNK